nr:hypothetical protein [Nannocystis sp.]
MQDNFTTTATTGGPTTSGTVPTTSDGVGSSPVATVTGPLDESSSTAVTTTQEPETTTGDMANLPPTIELFTVSPKDPNQKQLSEAGPAELQLIVSADVVKVKLSLDGVELAKNLKPGDFPRNWDALSAKDNGLAREFEVIVEDAEGLTAKAIDHLDVQLPQTGAEKCSFEDPGKGAVTSVISALKYTPDAIIAVGTRETDVGLRLTVWKLNAETCEVLAGWPRSIVDWTAKNTFAAMTSIGAAVDVDEAGNIVVAGNFVAGGKLQSYVARLTPDGARQWEKEGQVGDEVRGVAIATAQFKNRVFVAGAQRTSDIPVRTDGAIWVYITDGESVYIQPPVTLKAPFTPEETDQDEKNERSEKVHAVVIQPGTGYALAVGERELWDGIKLPYYRAFTVLVHPLGDVVGTWTSTADASLLHDAARSVAVCGDGFLAGGWTRDEPPDSKPHPMIFWIETDGASMQRRPEPQLASTQIQGIACDKEGKIVSAGTRTAGSPDAQVFTVLGPLGPRTPYETGVPGDDGAGAVACDWRGICSWGGFRTANMKPYAFVRVHHP